MAWSTHPTSIVSLVLGLASVPMASIVAGGERVDWGQAARHGRVAGNRSSLGGCPTPSAVDGGFLAGVGVMMRSW